MEIKRIGRIKGDVSFTENNGTYHAQVIEVRDLEQLRVRVAHVERQVQEAGPRLARDQAAALREATQDVSAELAEPMPSAGRVRSALDRLKGIAAGIAAAAGIATSVESIVSTLSGQ
jgi:phage-related minor tail protein